MVNQHHGRYENQRKESSEAQPEDDRPGEGPPESNIVSADKNMRIKLGKECFKVDVQTNGQRNKTKDGS